MRYALCGFVIGCLLAIALWVGIGWLISLTGFAHPYAAALVLWICTQTINAIALGIESSIQAHHDRLFWRSFTHV